MTLPIIDFPDNPSTGDSFTADNGVTYTWYNNRWNGKINDVILTLPPDQIQIENLQNVCETPANDGEVLSWNGTEWCPAAVQDGAPGEDGTSPIVTVGATNTLAPGQPANVTQTFNDDGTELFFSIPKGDKGEPGTGITFKGTIPDPGPPSNKDEVDGDMWVDSNGDAWIWETDQWIDAGDFTGPPGAPGTQVSVGSTTTVNPGTPASVSETINGNNLTLNFSIPKGDKGDKGEPGTIKDLPDGVVSEYGRYEDGNLLLGTKFGRGGGSSNVYPIDFAVRTEVMFNGKVDFGNSAEVTGLNLNDDFDDVSADNPKNGQILEWSNNFWRPVDKPTGSASNVDLSGYAKRAADETISGQWTFEDRTAMAGVKLLGYTNPNSGNTNTFLHFYNSKTWEDGESADVALELDRITYKDGVELDMLCLKGGGLQVLPLNSPPTKRGGLNLFPTGIDLWRDGTEGGTAHIDFKSENSDSDQVGGFDVRMILDEFTYGAGDTYKMLDIRGGGVQIRNHPDAPIERVGVVNILPKGIDLITPALAGGNFQAHIDFKNEDNLAGWDSRIGMSGEPGQENLSIRCKRQLIFQDQTGRYTLSQLAGSSGGGGGGGMPIAGKGLYYSDAQTLNVEDSYAGAGGISAAEAQQIAYDVISDYSSIDNYDFEAD